MKGVMGIGLIFAALFVFVGCAPERQTMPRIVIAPGLQERLAWMDRVRLHDEGRQSMMEAQAVVRDEQDDVVMDDDRNRDPDRQQIEREATSAAAAQNAQVAEPNSTDAASVAPPTATPAPPRDDVRIHPGVRVVR